MSAAIAQRPSTHIKPPTSRSGSPMDGARTIKTEGPLDRPVASTKAADKKQSPRLKSSKQPASNALGKDGNTASHAETTQPLAPPPRPAPAQTNPPETPDYFSGEHNTAHFSLEPNPFEQQFGNPATETPGKSLLPPVAALTSPAPLLGGAPSAGGYNWSNSLRSGPLSPAMLDGPSAGYFDSHMRGGFPTPNESSLRTGLTPGGGGSMFPVASPSTQAYFNQLQSGGATPNTLDFHRTAINAAATKKAEALNATGSISQPQEHRAPIAPIEMDHTSQAQHQNFSPHDSDAANGLYLLAQAGNGTQSNNQYAMTNPPGANHGIPENMQTGSAETSPTYARHAARKNGSIGGSLSGSLRAGSGMSDEMSDNAEQVRPNTRAKGKRNSAGKGNNATNNRRKAEEAPSKQMSAKKAKTNASLMDMAEDIGDSDEEQNIKEEQYDTNGKKMTDEEKRKNFLERNRVAALKCRQRKKQWLANLQAKVEIFSSENDTLTATVQQLREEIVNLKTVLLAHKDCPVSQSQGISTYFQQQQGFDSQANPYGMAMANGQQQLMAAQTSRRFS